METVFESPDPCEEGKGPTPAKRSNPRIRPTRHVEMIQLDPTEGLVTARLLTAPRDCAFRSVRSAVRQCVASERPFSETRRFRSRLDLASSPWRVPLHRLLG